MAQKGRPAGVEKLQRLPVGKMPLSATDTIFQMIRITAILQHLFVVVGFQEGCMALFKMMDQVFAGSADIREHANFYSFGLDNKTMGIDGIMKFGEGRDVQLPDCHRSIGLKGND